MILYKNKISVTFFVFLIAATMSMSALVNQGTASAATVTTCKDFQTIIPPLFRGDPNVFCAEHGGFASNSMEACEDRETIIPGGFRGDPKVFCADHGGYEFAGATDDESPDGEPKYIKSDCDGPNISAGEPEDSVNHCGILDYLVLFINILSALVGIVVVASIIYGGIQYSSAGSDPQKISAAKQRIRNAIIAIIFFVFMYSLLNYLVPGGVL